jgi:hypothetical protein
MIAPRFQGAIRAIGEAGGGSMTCASPDYTVVFMGGDKLVKPMISVLKADVRKVG